MSVKTASELVSRAMRAAIKETMTPANEDASALSDRDLSSVAGPVRRQCVHDLHHRSHAYAGSVDELAAPGDMVDTWRLQLSRRETASFRPANGYDRRERHGHR